MANQIQQNTLPIQPPPQTPTPISRSTNWSKILLFTALGLIVITGSVFAGIQIGKKQVANLPSLTQQPATNSSASSAQTNPVQADQITVTGIIRTSGLREEEKQKFGLPAVNFQLTDFGNNQLGVYGYYLESSDKTIEALLGKCAQITGTVPEEWKNKNKDDAYSRIAFIPNKIAPVDNSVCNPPTAVTNDNTGEEKLTLRGIATYGKRPAPDIGYDYQFKLTKPLLVSDSSSEGQHQVSNIDVTPGTKNVWLELENNINKEVEIQGFMKWGYSESRYFDIIAIKPVQ